MRNFNINKQYFHICWFCDIDKFNLNDEKEKKIYLQMILTRGKAKDIRKLNFDEIRKYLDELHLPKEVKKLWQDYFKYKSNNG
jgi:hypothetical protein